MALPLRRRHGIGKHDFRFSKPFSSYAGKWLIDFAAKTRSDPHVFPPIVLFLKAQHLTNLAV